MEDPWPDVPAIPPYLFRAASDQSRGKNTIDEIDPLYGWTNAKTTEEETYSADLTALENEEEYQAKAIRMVYNHLKFHYGAVSQFSSWSVSLLWVLVHAIRKLQSREETNVLVYIMDTSKLPSSRINSSQDLLRKYSLKCWSQVADYAEGEYLIHGKLHNTNLWQAVTLETLITAGLWKAFIELHDPERWHKLNGQVKYLRYEYFKEPHAITAPSMKILRDLAECFGLKWRGAMMIALIASRKRDISLKSIKTLYSHLGDMEVPQLPWYDASLRICQCGLYGIEESWQFMELLYWLHDRKLALESATLQYNLLGESQQTEASAQLAPSKKIGLLGIRLEPVHKVSRSPSLSGTPADALHSYELMQPGLITPLTTP